MIHFVKLSQKLWWISESMYDDISSNECIAATVCDIVQQKKEKNCINGYIFSIFRWNESYGRSNMSISTKKKWRSILKSIIIKSPIKMKTFHLKRNAQKRKNISTSSTHAHKYVHITATYSTAQWWNLRNAQNMMCIVKVTNSETK